MFLVTSACEMFVDILTENHAVLFLCLELSLAYDVTFFWNIIIKTLTITTKLGRSVS